MMSSPWSLPLRLLIFVAWFVGQLVTTSVAVSALILTPGRQPKPAIVRVDLDAMSDAELTLLVALITITPDTLVVALDRHQQVMFVHGMFVAGDPDRFRAAVKDTQRHLLRGIRLRPPLLSPSEARS